MHSSNQTSMVSLERYICSKWYITPPYYPVKINQLDPTLNRCLKWEYWKYAPNTFLAKPNIFFSLLAILLGVSDVDRTFQYFNSPTHLSKFDSNTSSKTPFLKLWLFLTQTHSCTAATCYKRTLNSPSWWFSQEICYVTGWLMMLITISILLLVLLVLR